MWLDEYSAYERYAELVDSWIYRIERAAFNREKIQWNKLSINAILPIWQRFAETKLVFAEKSMDRIANIVIKNITRIEANTILAGHTPIDPFSDYELEIKEESEDMEFLYDYLLCDENGRDAYSDYGLDKLRDLAIKLLRAESYEESLYLCDQIFSVAHQRNDLSRFFIREGSNGLDELFQGGH